jgi:hypothetical protein
MGKENQITKADQNQAVKLDNIETLGQMMEYGKVLVDSKIVPFTSAEQVVAVVQQGRELGLGALTSIYNTHFIQGKPALSIHAINALLSKAGIIFTTELDAVYVDVNMQPITDAKDAADLKTRTFDRLTKIKFQKKTDIGIVTEFVSFSWKDATKAGLTDKDNWKNYPAVMLWNRCFAIGARRIGADALLGLMEVTEAADTFDVDYKVDSEGNVETINI